MSQSADTACMPGQRPRVLWVSESPRLHTGMGRVASEVIAGLTSAGSCEMAVLGWGWWKELPEDRAGRAALFAPGSRPWARDRIDEVIHDFGPDIVVTSGPALAVRVGAQLNTRPFVTWVGHVTFEAAPVPPAALAGIRQMDHVVVPSQWCRNVLKEAGLEHDVRVIPHGVDLSVFHPLPNREEIRQEAGLSGRFVVGCVARNEFRKQLPVLVKAFARLARECPEAVLYLHTDPAEGSWPMRLLTQRYGVSSRTAFTRGLNGPVGIDSHLLNRIYNLFDVLVLPTMGEAFGLPLLEAMAAGVPVIATDCSAVAELVQGRGELAKVSEWLTMNWDGSEYAIADAADIAGKLAKLRASPDLRREYSERGLAFARETTWDRSVEQWAQAVDGIWRAQRRAVDARRLSLRTFQLPEAKRERDMGQIVEIPAENGA